MKLKHTPGPWYVSGSGNAIEVLYKTGAMLFGRELSSMVCMMPHHPNKKQHPTYEANAHLISKAPELLQALEVCLEVIKNEYPEDQWNDYNLGKYESLIKQAKGE